MATAKLIGASIKRREDPRFITGKGNYTDDLKLPGMTYAAFVRSPHAHARIRSIDTARARAHAGVVAVFTGADMAGVNSLPCGWDLRKEKNIPGVVQDLAMVPHMPLTSERILKPLYDLSNVVGTGARPRVASLSFCTPVRRSPAM